jgi:Coatomer epsilon subunit
MELAQSQPAPKCQESFYLAGRREDPIGAINNGTTSKAGITMSTEPDELYTLRAQYALGHYHLALEEAKTIARRPMSSELKAEREEFVQRCQLGLGQPAVGGDTTGTCIFRDTIK